MFNYMKVDPITVEVLSNAFMSIAEEMGGILVRTAYSTNIKERKDCSCAIFNAKGETIAQAEHIPVHLGSMLGIVQKITQKYDPSEIEPGDMFVANDPYSGGGTHLPDITIAAPIFHDGEIVAYVANIAHHSDVGGRVPGSMSGDSTSIFQEGLRIPPIHIMKKGKLLQDVMDVIMLNCRTAFERTGDIMAQVAANTIGAERTVDVINKYGRDIVLSGMEELMNYGERKMRAGIHEIPNGEYEFEDYMDDDGIDIGKRVPIHLKLTVKDESMYLDFTGTAPQVKGAVNVVENALKATVYYSLKAIVDPTLPPNGGFYRPIEIYAPAGTLVNPKVPGACGARTDACQRVADVVFGAMAQVVPKQVMAGCNSAVTTVIFSGNDEKHDRFFVYPESLGGGFGARYNKDGLDGVHVHITNSSNLPIECMEAEYPIMVDRYEIRNDSGGAGEYRGGLGYRRDYRILQDTIFGSHGDRQKVAPWGLEGGLSGAPGRFVINPETPGEKVLPSAKSSEIELKEGDIMSAQTPGSGGYGNPFKRRPEYVLEDVLNEKVSAENARTLYGVVINMDTKTVDEAATAALRK
ncbi:hydantoinase B/oxoprolinase family protein [Oscillibacter hominis]|nr:hydantoinase B/oxoprolinase family protein [Oscillibacter hominis]